MNRWLLKSHKTNLRWLSAIEACIKNHVRLSAVFQSRFGKNVQQIKKAIDSGRFGQLVLVSAQVKWYRSQEYYDSAGLLNLSAAFTNLLRPDSPIPLKPKR